MIMLLKYVDLKLGLIGKVFQENLLYLSKNGKESLARNFPERYINAYVGHRTWVPFQQYLIGTTSGKCDNIASFSVLPHISFKLFDRCTIFPVSISLVSQTIKQKISIIIHVKPYGLDSSYTMICIYRHIYVKHALFIYHVLMTAFY